MKSTRAWFATGAACLLGASDIGTGTTALAGLKVAYGAFIPASLNAVSARGKAASILGIGGIGVEASAGLADRFATGLSYDMQLARGSLLTYGLALRGKLLTFGERIEQATDSPVDFVPRRGARVIVEAGVARRDCDFRKFDVARQNSGVIVTTTYSKGSYFAPSIALALGLGVGRSVDMFLRGQFENAIKEGASPVAIRTYSLQIGAMFGGAQAF